MLFVNATSSLDSLRCDWTSTFSSFAMAPKPLSSSFEQVGMKRGVMHGATSLRWAGVSTGYMARIFWMKLRVDSSESDLLSM